MDAPLSRRKLIQGAGMGAAGIGIDLDEIFNIPPAEPGHDRILSVLDDLVPKPPSNEGYPKDPVQFMREILGINPWKKQEEIVYSVWENRYTSVASCHGIGKSYITAATLITFLHLHENSIVLSTAPTGRQVEHVLWRNVRFLHAHARKPLLGNRPLTTRYDIAEAWYAMGFKPTDSETDPIQGFHAEKVLCIIDEAAGAQANIIDGMQAALTTADSRMLMIGNPTSTSGPFYDSHHSKKTMYKTFKVAWPDTPNCQEGRTVLPYLITQQWVDEVIEKYGEESAYVQSRVYANWVSSEDVLIPQNVIIAANERTPEEIAEEQDYEDWEMTAGLDVARGGSDESVLTVRKGPVILAVRPIQGKEGWEVAGKVLKVIREEFKDCIRLCIDEIGIGSSVLDHAQGLVYNFPDFPNLDVVGVNFGKKPHDQEKYLNQRCEAYGIVADRFRERRIIGNHHIPEETIADLSDVHYKFNGRHTQPVIEPKDDFRKRTGHSPDHGDSFVLAFYNPPPDEEVTMGALAFGYADQKWGKL